MDEKEKKDFELVREARAGVKSSFDELVMRHSKQMYGIAYGLLGNHEDAEEVVQDAFVKAYKNISMLRDENIFAGWLARIVVNLSRNRYHWNKIRGAGQHLSISQTKESLDSGESKELELLSNLTSPDTELERAEIENKIITAIQNLPEMYREPIVLRHVKDMNYKEIANILGLNLETVKTRISRGRAMLVAKIGGKI